MKSLAFRWHLNVSTEVWHALPVPVHVRALRTKTTIPKSRSAGEKHLLGRDEVVDHIVGEDNEGAHFTRPVCVSCEVSSFIRILSQDTWYSCYTS